MRGRFLCICVVEGDDLKWWWRGWGWTQSDLPAVNLRVRGTEACQLCLFRETRNIRATVLKATKSPSCLPPSWRLSRTSCPNPPLFFSSHWSTPAATFDQHFSFFSLSFLWKYLTVKHHPYNTLCEHCGGLCPEMFQCNQWLLQLSGHFPLVLIRDSINFIDDTSTCVGRLIGDWMRQFV